MAEKFDAIVVGAGASGNATSYLLAKAGLSVLQLERGEYPGSKNVQGAILYADMLEKIIPDFREEAPLERHIIEQRIWMMDEKSHVGTHYRSDEFNEERPNRYTILRAQFDKWFASKAREAGALQICETTVTELVKDGDKVVGVRTDRGPDVIYADVVVLADGVNSLLAKQAGFHGELSPGHVALAVKEMHFLPPEVIEQRFNLKGDEGVVIENMGTITHGMVGTGFIYTNRESISIGIGCLVGDFKKTKVAPYTLLEEFKKHPSVAPLLHGSEVKEYVAHLIPEGGYDSMPSIAGAGWVIVGDSGGFVNAVHREGSNLAMTTGRLAAEAIIALKAEGKPFTKANLLRYREAVENSFVGKDLKKYRKVPDYLHDNRYIFTQYPALINAAFQRFFRVDGIDKKTKQKQIGAAFKASRSRFGILADAFKFVRAFR